MNSRKVCNNQEQNNKFWDNISFIAQSILAHVNISFDGSSRTIHIDIVPTEEQISVHSEQEVIQQKSPNLELGEKESNGDVIQEATKPVKETE